MKLGSSRLRKARSRSSAPHRSATATSTIAWPSRCVGKAERHRVGDRAAGQRRLLDLGRADAVAATLDHRVVAADGTEQAILALGAPVARPDRHAAIACERPAPA